MKTMTRTQAYAALEAAGIKITREQVNGVTFARLYDPSREGAYMVLRDGFRNADFASFPKAFEGADSGKVSGAFASKVASALEAARSMVAS